MSYSTDIRRVEGMDDLAAFLNRERKRLTYRGLQGKTGVSRGALEAIIKRTSKKLPELETLQRIADAYDYSLDYVLEMAGANTTPPKSPSELARRLALIVAREPAWAPLLYHLQSTNPRLAGSVVVYLEALGSQQDPPANQ